MSLLQKRSRRHHSTRLRDWLPLAASGLETGEEVDEVQDSDLESDSESDHAETVFTLDLLLVTFQHPATLPPDPNPQNNGHSLGRRNSIVPNHIVCLRIMTSWQGSRDDMNSCMDAHASLCKLI